ncbi:hypothetical protein [Deinococcus sp. PEB2-67]
MRQVLMVGLLALCGSAGAVTAAFQSAVVGAVPSSYRPTLVGPEQYVVVGGAASLEYSPRDKSVTLMGEVGNGPMFPVVFDVAGRFSKTWCGVKDQSAAMDLFADWYMLGLKRAVEQQQGQRKSYLVTARLGTCRAMVLAGRGDTVLILTRVPGAAVWPAKITD